MYYLKDLLCKFSLQFHDSVNQVGGENKGNNQLLLESWWWYEIKYNFFSVKLKILHRKRCGRVKYLQDGRGGGLETGTWRGPQRGVGDGRRWKSLTMSLCGWVKWTYSHLFSDHTLLKMIMYFFWSKKVPSQVNRVSWGYF